MTRWLRVQETHPGQRVASLVRVPALFCLVPLSSACQEWCFFYIMAKLPAVLFSALLGSPQNILLMWQVTREGLGLSNLLNTGFCARTCIMTLGISLRNPTSLLRSCAYHRRGDGIEGQKRETCVADLGASKLLSKVNHRIYTILRLRHSLGHQVRVQAIMSVGQGLG